jgi:hypothetical protein
MFSQTFCETPAYSPNRDLMVNTYSNADFTDLSFCVGIYIHILRKSDGTGGQSLANVNSALARLNNAFNPYFIYFEQNAAIHYINNTTYYNTPSNLIGITTYDHSDGIDIYLGDDKINHPITGWGYGQIPNIGDKSKMVVTGSYKGNLLYPMVRSHIVAHEMGHIFNLWHTHHGTFPESGDPSQCKELVNASNNAVCGDYITDTPADPYMGFNVNFPLCEWTGSGTDINGDSYDPDEHNIMAYTHIECMQYFTYQQSRWMKSALYYLDFLQDVSYYVEGQINPCSSLTPLNYYPNAADNELNLDLTNKPENVYLYYLYDINGIEVVTGESPNVIETIDLSGLDDGIYFLHFYENATLVIKQIIIEH